MTYRIAVTSLALAAVIGIGGTARAAETKAEAKAETKVETSHTDLGPVEEFIASKLESVSELTDAQKEKIKTLMHDRLPAVKTLVRKFVAEQRALREVARVENVDEKAIRAQ